MAYTLNVLLAAALALALTYIVAYSAATNHMRLKLNNDNESATRSSSGFYLILIALIILMVALLSASAWKFPVGTSAQLNSRESTVEPARVNYDIPNIDLAETNVDSSAGLPPVQEALSEYALQVGAFSDFDNAHQILLKYQSQGHPTQLALFTDDLYHVFITPEDANSQEEVEAYARYYDLGGVIISLPKRS